MKPLNMALRRSRTAVLDRSPSANLSSTPEAAFAFPSAARLAAEMAFSIPDPSASSQVAPVVMVRKTRLQSQSPDLPEAQLHAPSSLAGLTSVPPPKESRVFRIETPKLTVAGTPALAGAPSSVEQGALGQAPHRRRQIAQSRRPGPALRVLARQIERTSHGGDTRTGHGDFQWLDARVSQIEAPSPAAQLRALLTQLAGLDQVFEVIRAAQSFELPINRFADKWGSLLEAADALRCEVDARRRP